MLCFVNVYFLFFGLEMHFIGFCIVLYLTACYVLKFSSASTFFILSLSSFLSFSPLPLITAISPSNLHACLPLLSSVRIIYIFITYFHLPDFLCFLNFPLVISVLYPQKSSISFIHARYLTFSLSSVYVFIFYLRASAFLSFSPSYFLLC